MYQTLCSSEQPRVYTPGVVEVTDPGSILWPNGRIPYQIAVVSKDVGPSFSEAMRKTIESGIANWNNALGGAVQFVPKTLTDRNFLNIWRIPDEAPGGNWAEIGFGLGGERKMFLRGYDKREELLRMVHHELGHVLGLHHEQLRPDRDAYLIVYEGQMPRGSYPRDWEQTLCKVGTGIGPYEQNSIMHYWSEWDRPNLRVSSSVRDNNGNHVPAIGGTIKETTNYGWATRIEWDNGVVLVRPDPRALPAGAEYFELSGLWQSNIGVEYFFNQSGRSFTWRAQSLGQFGEGQIENIDDKWTEANGRTPVKVFVDKMGNPVHPNWDMISPETAAGVIQMYTDPDWGSVVRDDNPS